MKITELHSLTASQAQEVGALIEELKPGCNVSPERLEAIVSAPGTHFFTAMNEEGRIAGCATLCVFESPTGRKASVEDVIVGECCRGQHIGRRLMEHIIDFSRSELGDVDLHLTSRPERVAANALYRSLGFHQRETNVYKLEIRKSL